MVMLDFIYMGSADLFGTGRERKIQKQAWYGNTAKNGFLIDDHNQRHNPESRTPINLLKLDRERKTSPGYEVRSNFKANFWIFNAINIVLTVFASKQYQFPIITCIEYKNKRLISIVLVRQRQNWLNYTFLF